MVTANMLDVKTNLSKYVRMLELGQEDVIIIARNNKPVARIVKEHQQPQGAIFGYANGMDLFDDDWDSEEFNAEIAALMGVE